MKNLIIIVLTSFFVSCAATKKKTDTHQEDKLELYRRDTSSYVKDSAGLFTKIEVIKEYYLRDTGTNTIIYQPYPVKEYHTVYQQASNTSEQRNAGSSTDLNQEKTKDENVEEVTEQWWSGPAKVVAWLIVLWGLMHIVLQLLNGLKKLRS